MSDKDTRQAPADWSKEKPSDVMLAIGLLARLARLMKAGRG